MTLCLCNQVHSESVYPLLLLFSCSRHTLHQWESSITASQPIGAEHWVRSWIMIVTRDTTQVTSVRAIKQRHCCGNMCVHGERRPELLECSGKTNINIRDTTRDNSPLSAYLEQMIRSLHHSPFWIQSGEVTSDEVIADNEKIVMRMMMVH